MRACLSGVVAVLVVLSYAGHPQVGLLVTLAAVALVLDAVDGAVARRTVATERGAAFDMEVDAFLILVLSVAVAATVGWWVLLIGSARYLLLLATRLWPWLGDPIPPRRWAKGVAALQGVVLVVVAADVLPHPAAVGSLVVALVLLVVSFGHQVWWLRRARWLRCEPLGEPRNQEGERPAQPVVGDADTSRPGFEARFARTSTSEDLP